GWGGSYVTICIGANCTNYTVAGGSASVNIGVNVGQAFTISYSSAGGFENQNSYSISQYGSPIFAANSPPQSGQVYSATVSCDPPPAPASDCLGAVAVCSNAPMINQQAGPGTQELNSTNRGCLAGNEHWGQWFIISTSTAGPLEFTIDPAVNMDYDFAVWGPFPPGSTAGNICPPTSPPARCNFSGIWGPTGLQSPPPNGAFSPALMANAGDVFILYVDQWTGGPNYQFDLILGNGPSSPAINCNVLPIELLSFDAKAAGDQVLVDWSTATENNTAWFDVERSADGVGFQAIGRVNAAGHAMQTTAYHFVDDQPLNGLSYYRLHSVDADGATSNSHAVPVLIAATNGLTVHPNPTHEALWMSIE